MRNVLSGILLFAAIGVATSVVSRSARRPAGGPSAESVEVTETADQVQVAVRPLMGTPYRLELRRQPFAMRVLSEGTARFSLVSLGGAPATLRTAERDGKDVRLTLEATDPVSRYTMRLSFGADRVRMTVEGTEKHSVRLCYDMTETGHWYGHGELDCRAQPWPFSSGEIIDDLYGPASYKVLEPFWYSSRGAGLVYEESDPLDVRINEKKSGQICLATKGGQGLALTHVIARNAPEVFARYFESVPPVKTVQATRRHFELPVWNSWAQFYVHVTQEKFLTYVRGLRHHGLRGHTIQLDDKWESNYGNMTFNAATFPDPAAMSREIHELGYGFGVWVTLWMNTDSEGYREAERLGYLLRKPDGPGPCHVKWWNGEAGLVDLANPEAFKWYQARLRELQARYGIDGFKFDTRFFEETCAPYPGTSPRDYRDLGARLAGGYDLQGVGIRVGWKSQKHGFIIRQMDKDTHWEALRIAIRQNLTLSAIGYPFVASDMIGGSLEQPPPEKKVLIRWAQAAALMPVMYGSTSPTSVEQPWKKGKPHAKYDEQTRALYRDAIQRHEALGHYIWRQVKRAEGTSQPIMRPLFFDFPNDEATYLIDDQWLLGDLLLVAPIVGPVDRRDVHLPPGVWWDVLRGAQRKGPTNLRGYTATLSETPIFVRMTDPEAPGLKDLGLLLEGAAR